MNVEKIGFLAWYRFDDIASIKTRNKLKIFYEYVIKNIERNINGNGGIAGRNIYIDLLDIPVPYDIGKEVYSEKLASSPSLLFAKGPGVFCGIGDKKDAYIKTVESASRLLFSNSFNS